MIYQLGQLTKERTDYKVIKVMISDLLITYGFHSLNAYSCKMPNFRYKCLLIFDKGLD